MHERRAKSSPKGVSISVVVPVYMEEENIRPFLERIEPVFLRMGCTYEIVFVLDPSPDKSETLISEEIERNPNISLIVMSRRFGQPAATTWQGLCPVLATRA